ncbi:MAG: methionine adenosyltransferase [Aeriscardovia sp.]|nr:methionine adenosyltransferase [Aeriscardovia sp.]
MTNSLHPLSAESVTEGHPDKLCDKISDSVLDDLLTQDKSSHVAVETVACKGMFMVCGEVNSRGYCDVQKVVRNAVKEVGYADSSIGLDWQSCGVMVSITSQSPEIDESVRKAGGEEEQGAGDQGVVFGFACDETKVLMPLPITLANRLTMKLSSMRKRGMFPWLRPDGKAQVTVDYEGFEPKRINTILISAQHTPEADLKELGEKVKAEVVRPVLEEWAGDIEASNFNFIFNPSGSFVLGGPAADTGLTGRKIIVDAYGNAGRSGGGAFSGKDPSKVDRSGAYAARWVAKNLVASGALKRAEVQIAYAIGRAEPVAVDIETFGTEARGLSSERITEAVRETFDLRPGVIIRELDLLRPIYSPTACYGHFGREEEVFTWERTDKASKLRSLLLG